MMALFLGAGQEEDVERLLLGRALFPTLNSCATLNPPHQVLYLRTLKASTAWTPEALAEEPVNLLLANIDTLANIATCTTHPKLEAKELSKYHLSSHCSPARQCMTKKPLCHCFGCLLAANSSNSTHLFRMSACPPPSSFVRESLQKVSFRWGESLSEISRFSYILRKWSNTPAFSRVLGLSGILRILNISRISRRWALLKRPLFPKSPFPILICGRLQAWERKWTKIFTKSRWDNARIAIVSVHPLSRGGTWYLMLGQANPSKLLSSSFSSASSKSAVLP